MDLELSSEQQMLDDALRALFSDHAGYERARDIGTAIDHDLMAQLNAGGFLDVGYDAGPIEATIVAERAAQFVACAPIVARVLVAPLAGVRDLPDLVGLVASPNALVRYAGSCDAYLVLDGDAASVASRDDVDVEMVPSRAGYPMGRVRVRRSEPLGAGSGDALRRAWQVGIAAEVGALAQAAVEFSARHVTDRQQFGRPIGSASRSARSRRCSTGWRSRIQTRKQRSGWRGAAPGITPTSSSPRRRPPSPR